MACIFFQKRSHAVVLYNTLLAACIEKAVWMKTQDELIQKVRLTPRVPQVVLISNSQNSQRGLRNQEARSSWDPSSDSESYGETCSNVVDYRISWVPLSAVEQQKYNTWEQGQEVDREVSEPPTQGILFKDLSQTQKINKFSKESQDFLADMTNTEVFELCENSSKQQCPECNTYWEIGIIYCSCGRNKKSSQRPTEFEQNNYDVTSIPGYVTKKNSSRDAKHGPSERQRLYYQAKQMLKKTRQKKHGNHPTILSRWYTSESYRTSLSDIGWKEKDIMLYDRIATSQQKQREFTFCIGISR